jgi:hypothetical protein
MLREGVMRTKPTDWNAYRELFPIRYLREGLFDAVTSAAVITRSSSPRKKALEIGCGTTPCKAMEICLYYGKIDAYFLDKYVEETPGYPESRVDWDTDKIFHLIFLRGSINYLDEYELRRTSEMLAPGGLLFANTFLNPPSSQFRERTEEISSGNTLIERSRLIDQHVVQHQLIYKGEIHEHFFYYRTTDEFEVLLGEGCTLTPYGKGSVLIMKQGI